MNQTTPPTSDAIALAVRDVCESDPANPDDPDTLKISVQHLTQILEDHFGSAREIATQPGEGDRDFSGLVLAALSRAYEHGQRRVSPNLKEIASNICQAAKKLEPTLPETSSLRALRRVRQVMGPAVPACCQGCQWEWNEALSIIEAALSETSPPHVADALDGVTVLADLRKHVEDNFTSQLAFAQSLCVSTSYVSDVLNGRREIPPDWVFCLGFRKSGWERFNPAIASRAEAGDR